MDTLKSVELKFLYYDIITLPFEKKDKLKAVHQEIKNLPLNAPLPMLKNCLPPCMTMDIKMKLTASGSNYQAVVKRFWDAIFFLLE